MKSQELTRVGKIVLGFTPQLRKVQVSGCSIEVRYYLAIIFQVNLEALDYPTLRALEAYSFTLETSKRKNPKKTLKRKHSDAGNDSGSSYEEQ